MKALMLLLMLLLMQTLYKQRENQTTDAEHQLNAPSVSCRPDQEKQPYI